MIQVSLITESILKGIIPISTNNTITTPLTQTIMDSQEFYIRPILCTPLYEELQTQIMNNTVTPDNQNLLDIIYPCLAYWVYYRYLVNNWAKVREQGVVNQNGNTATTISLNDLTFLRGEAESSAKMYEIRLQRFLQDNEALYPLWKCECEETCATVPLKNRRFRYI